MNLRDVSQLLYLIKLTSQEMITQFEEETGFSLTRYELMMFLTDYGIATQQMIQQELKIDSAAVTRHLKQLEEHGYVTRKRNKDNNREIFVHVTDKALSELNACQHKLTKNDPFLTLSQEEATQLTTLLKKIGLNLPRKEDK